VLPCLTFALLLPLIQTCIALLGGETSSPPAPSIVKSHHDDADGESKAHNIPVFHPIDLVGCTFLHDSQEDGQHFYAQIVRVIEDHKVTLDQDSECLKFLYSINDDTLEEVMSYNDILAYIDKIIQLIL